MFDYKDQVQGLFKALTSEANLRFIKRDRNRNDLYIEDILKRISEEEDLVQEILAKSIKESPHKTFVKIVVAMDDDDWILEQVCDRIKAHPVKGVEALVVPIQSTHGENLDTIFDPQHTFFSVNLHREEHTVLILGFKLGDRNHDTI